MGWSKNRNCRQSPRCCGRSRIVARGIRRPGYPADRWAEDFVHRFVGSLGLEAVGFEPVESPLLDRPPRRADRRRRSVGRSDRLFLGSVVWAGPWSRVSSRAGIRRIRAQSLARSRSTSCTSACSRTSSRCSDDPRRRLSQSSSPAALAEAAGPLIPTAPFLRAVIAFRFHRDAGDDGTRLGRGDRLRGRAPGYPSGGCEYYGADDGRFRWIPGVYVSESSGDRLLAFLSRPGQGHGRTVAERGVTVSAERRRRAAGSGRRMGHRRDPSRRPMGLGSGGRLWDSDVVGPGNRVGGGARVERPHRLIFVAQPRAHVAWCRQVRVHRAPSSDDGTAWCSSSSGQLHSTVPPKESVSTLRTNA